MGGCRFTKRVVLASAGPLFAGLVLFLGGCASPAGEELEAGMPEVHGYDDEPDGGAPDGVSPAVLTATHAPSVPIPPGEVPGTLPDGAPLPSLRILFVGNSYTFSNDMPELVAMLAAGSPETVDLDVEMHTRGGARLEDHIRRLGTAARIRQGGWTHVVLQAQSVEALWHPHEYRRDLRALVRVVKEVGATPVLYETWARRQGHSLYAETPSRGGPVAMQAAIRAAYRDVAEETGAVVAPVGDAWETALALFPRTPLYDPDGSHPALAGSYLAACVFFGVLTGQDPSLIDEWPDGLSEELASTLRVVATQVTRL